MGKEITKTKIAPNINLQEPPLYKVIYINDEVTTMEFVVDTLITFFNHSLESAQEITTKIHNDGSGVAAILPYEIAEQKGVEITQLARASGYPLTIKLDPDQ